MQIFILMTSKYGFILSLRMASACMTVLRFVPGSETRPPLLFSSHWDWRWTSRGRDLGVADVRARLVLRVGVKLLVADLCRRPLVSVSILLLVFFFKGNYLAY